MTFYLKPWTHWRQWGSVQARVIFGVTHRRWLVGLVAFKELES